MHLHFDSTPRDSDTGVPCATRWKILAYPKSADEQLQIDEAISRIQKKAETQKIAFKKPQRREQQKISFLKQ